VGATTAPGRAGPAGGLTRLVAPVAARRVGRDTRDPPATGPRDDVSDPRLDRRALRDALRSSAPWLTATDVGPQAVDAGACDRCGDRPRLLPTCGPVAAAALCRDCAELIGDDGWCDGHLDDGREARAWAAALPPRWADWVVLWWVATGEVRWTPDQHAPLVADLPSRVRAALPSA
jgi:hypothetical protein